jgi:hypothetical protein
VALFFWGFAGLLACGGFFSSWFFGGLAVAGLVFLVRMMFSLKGWDRKFLGKALP